ncbi:hypothetical protein [Streptomyces sp. NPDC060035]|uniref:hypothetical protein n=1 Tax=Streptomyces sp. NPDC060035 TaxID=3347044 RepID=UPI0036BF0102
MRVRTVLAALALAATATLGGAGMAAADENPSILDQAFSFGGFVAGQALAPAAVAPEAGVPVQG